MSKLYYRIPLCEEYYDTQDAKNIRLPQTTFRYNLPHEKTVGQWFAKEWNDAHMEQYFSDILKDKVQSCIMKPLLKIQEGKRYLFGNVTITFQPGFRLSAKKRDACWEQMDAQITDGFGENYDGTQIPNTPDGYCIRL